MVASICVVALGTLVGIYRSFRGASATIITTLTTSNPNPTLSSALFAIRTVTSHIKIPVNYFAYYAFFA
jgi:hypothetical protein